MDYSLTTLFVLPTSNTLPTTGSTADLAVSQFGIFKPDYTPATALNVAAQKYIILAQRRPVSLPSTGTKKSYKIYANNVVEWYKVTAFSTAAVQIIDITDFSAACGEDVTISLRAKSFYLDTAYFNGLTKSYTITTPCCDCGSDPCTDVDDQALVDRFVTAINADNGFNGMGRYIIAERLGTGGSSKLRLTGRVLPAEPTTADLTNFQFQFDRLYFWAWAYKGPETSQDFNVWDSCDPLATVTRAQESTYPRGTSAEVKQLEKDYLSPNTAPIARQIFKNVNFNQGFSSEVVDGTYYDFYYLKFKNPENNSNNPVVSQDSAVILCNPTGQNSGTIAVLTAFLGSPTDETGLSTTTTTTTAH